MEDDKRELYNKEGLMQTLRMGKDGRFIIGYMMKRKEDLLDYTEVILDDGDHVLLCPKSIKYFKENRNRWDSREELGGHVNKGNRKDFIEQYPLTLEQVYKREF